MPLKNPEAKILYDREYHRVHDKLNRDKIRKYHSTRREKDRLAWKKYWKLKKQKLANTKRKEMIGKGLIYKSRKPYF